MHVSAERLAQNMYYIKFIQADPDVLDKRAASTSWVKGKSQVDAYSSHKPVPVYKTTRRQNTEVYPKTCPTRLHCIYVQLLVQHGEYYGICQGHSTLYNVPADLPDRTAVNLSHTRIPPRAKLSWTIFDGSQKLQLFFPQTYLQKTSNNNNHYTNLDHHHLTVRYLDWFYMAETLRRTT